MSRTSAPLARLASRSLLALLSALAVAIASFPLAARAEAPEPQRAAPAPIAPELSAAADVRSEGDEPLQVVLLLEQANLDAVAGDHDAVVAELRRVADATQGAVEEELRAREGELGGIQVLNRLWITNALLLEVPAVQASGQLSSLATIPGVRRLVPNFTVTAIEPGESGEPSGPGASFVEDRTWGVDRVEAQRVWNELGILGEGVRVAVLDTGVDIAHPDLDQKMVTDAPGNPNYPGGWMEFDEAGNLVASTPHDSDTHGTHVSGTVLGGDASGYDIGVAPAAGLMHGLVIPGGAGSFVQVAAGMQWAVAPTDASGQPAGEPADVVSMSLGAPGYFDEMIAPTLAIEAAGVFPAFAIGNEDLFGNCGVGVPIGSSSPGNVYEAVGVGATDVADDVADFSCGEVVDRSDWTDPQPDWPEQWVTPDVSAPGVDTYSAAPGGGWSRKSGTSMATPHVAGTVALMRSAAPELGVEALLDTLEDTSFFDDRYGDERPNTRYGYGRIDAFEATAQVAIDSGITGTVTAADTGEPIAGATVTVAETGASVATEDDGTYTLRLEPGTYELTATAFGRETVTVSDVSVVAEQFTTVDMALTAAPTGAVAGTVTFADSGVGVPGVTVTVDDTPLTATTGPDGGYLIEGLPAGETWTVRATAEGFPNPAPVDVLVTAGETAVANFELASPPLQVGILGDYGQELETFLAETGVAAVPVAWGDDYAGYSTIIVNRPGDPGEAAFDQFLAATDANGTGVIFLDTWSTSGNGIFLLNKYLDNPAVRETGFTASTDERTYYEVLAEHPVLEGYEPGDDISHLVGPGLKDYAWFDDYTGDGVQVLADVGTADEGTLGHGIAVQQRDGNRHALLSMHGASLFFGPEDWTPASAQILLNALDWTELERGDEFPLFVYSDLTVEPDVVKAGEPVTVTVDVTNVGTASGEHTATLYVDGEEEDTATVTLDSGQTETLTFTVTRAELGTFTVEIGPLTDSFRVRAPIVDLTARTVTGPGRPPAGPLADATVELVTADGELVPVGTTDADGTLSFESVGVDEEVTVVVRRAATADQPAYLLQRPVRIRADGGLVFEPRTLAEVGATAGAYDLSAVLDLQATPVSPDHQVWTYLRSELSAPYGFAFAPGKVVATIGTYDALHVHAFEGLSRDWWFASEIIAPLELLDPTGVTHELAGPAAASLDITQGDGTEFTATWAVTDAAGNPFDVALATDLGPFAEVDDSAVLEEIGATLRGEAPNESEVLMRLVDPSGTVVHEGGVSWDERAVTRDLADLVDEVQDGTYTLELEVDMGPYVPGTVTASGPIEVVAAPTRTLDPSTVAPGESFSATITFGAPDGAFSVSESIAPAGGAGATRIGNGWPVTGWTTSAPATYDDRGTWTFADGAQGPVTLTYTVAAPLNVIAPSDWTLSGMLTAGDEVQPIGGAANLTVAEEASPAPAVSVGGESAVSASAVEALAAG